MEPIKEVVQNVIGALENKKKRCPISDPNGLLKKVLTKKEQAHIKCNYLKKGILPVDVDSSSWLYSLSLQKEALLDKLREKSPEIKDIRFRIGEIK